MMNHRRTWVDLLGLGCLVLIGVGLRWSLQDYPNVSPVAALALLAGCVFSRRTIAVAVPLGIMLVSDLKFGSYDLLTMLSVYGCLTVPVLAGPWLRKQIQSQHRMMAVVITGGVSGLACSIIFFMVTNFAVWLSSSMYPASLSGLAQCYSQAIPFFRHTLMGDLSFSILFLGCYAVALQWALRHEEKVVTP